jgi:hypothetical protein
MAAEASGNGYWLVAKDGGVFSFGGAGFFGSMGGSGVDDVIGMFPAADGQGYSVIELNGEGHRVRELASRLPGLVWRPEV